MINSNFNAQFVDGNQNSLSGKSDLQTFVNDLNVQGGGIQNPLTSNIDGINVYTVVNIRDPVASGDAVNLNYFNTHTGGTPSLIRNNTVLTSQLQANPTQLLNGTTPLNMNAQKITNLQNFPTVDTDAANKKYVDDQLALPKDQIQNAGTNPSFARVKCLDANEIDIYCNNVIQQQIQTGQYDVFSTLTDFHLNTVTGIALPTSDNDCANKQYVDNLGVIKMPITRTLAQISTDNLQTNPVDMNNQQINNLADPILNSDGVNKGFVQTNYMPIGQKINTIATNNPTDSSWSNYTYKITNLGDPTSNQDASTKKYVDDSISTAGSSYLPSSSTLNSIANAHPTTADISMSGFKLTGLADGNAINDAVALQQLTTGLLTKYNTTTPLQNITLATGNVNVNNNKITNLAIATNPSDAVRFDQINSAVPTKIQNTTGTSVECKVNDQIDLVSNANVINCIGSNTSVLTQTLSNLIPVQQAGVEQTSIIKCQVGSPTDVLCQQLVLESGHKLINAQQTPISYLYNKSSNNVGTLNNQYQLGISPGTPLTDNTLSMLSNSYASFIGQTLQNQFSSKTGYTTSPAVTVTAGTQFTDKNYVDTQVATKQSQAQADARYYLNTTPLNSITIPTASVSLNSQKITNLQAGSTTNDAYQFGQAQTALGLKVDKTSDLQTINSTAPLIQNLNLNTGFKTLVKTADQTNIQEALNVDFWNTNNKPCENLYIKTTTIPTVSTQVTGFSVISQQTSTNNNIVFSANNITLKGGNSYQIYVQCSSVQSANNNTLNIRMVTTGNVDIYGDDSAFQASTGLSNTQSDNHTGQFIYKPTVDTTIYAFAQTVTAITSCVITIGVIQLPTNFTVVSQIIPAQPQESLQLLSAQTNPSVNTILTDSFWTNNTFNNLSTITYSNGTITLPANKVYEITLDSQFTNSVTSAIMVFELYNITANTTLFTSSYSRIVISAVGVTQANSTTGHITRIFKPTVQTQIGIRCGVNSGNVAGMYTGVTVRNLTDFTSASNTTSNLTVNSIVDFASFTPTITNVPSTSTQIANKQYVDTQVSGRYLNTLPLNQITAPTGILSMNNQKITALATATDPSDAVRFDQLISSAGVQNTMLQNASGNNLYKFTNMINGSSQQDYVTLNQSQAFNNGYQAFNIYNPLLNTDNVKFNFSKFIYTDGTNDWFSFGKTGNTTIKVPDSFQLQFGALNSPAFTVDQVNGISKFSNLPVEIRNNDTAVTGNTGALLNVGLPYSGSYSVFSKGSVATQGSFVQIAPCSIAWKDNVVEQTSLEWVDNVKIYSFDYSNLKLELAGIDPDCLPSKHIEIGYLMEELNPCVYLNTEQDSSWNGHQVIDRTRVDQYLLARHQQKIQQQQLQITDLLARVSALEQAHQLQGKVQQLNMNPFVVDQLSSDEEQPVILDKNDVPVKSALYKSIF